MPDCAFPLEVSAHRGGVEIVERWADAWRDLCAEAADHQPFFRPEFIAAHIRAVNPQAKIMLLAVKRGDRLLLVLPLVEELGRFCKMPLRRLRAPVDFICGRFDAVRSKGPDGEAAIAATWRYLKEMKGWDLLQINETQTGSVVEQLVTAARSEGFPAIREPDRPSPYISIPPNAELLAKLPINPRLRTKLRQVRRQLEGDGSLRFYRFERADRDALDRFFELEARGWKGHAGSAVNCHPPRRQFFNELADAATRFKYFSLYMLEWKGQLIAAHFSLTYQSHCYSPIVAYDENFKQFAPGHLIVSAILQDCAARGIRGFDITGQDQEWKMKWTTETRPTNHHFVFKGPIGKFAYSVAAKLRPPAEVLPPSTRNGKHS